MKKRMLVGLASLMCFAGCSGTVPELGVENGTLMSCPATPNCVNSQAVDSEHAIAPLHYAGTVAEGQARLLQIIRSGKRTKVITTEDNYIRVEYASALFGFVDDVEFYFQPEKAGSTIIQIRSASRLGHSDLGVNRKRIEQIRSEMNSQKEE